MQKLLIRAALSLFHVTGAAAAPLDSAVTALYQANATVQRAVDLDACQGFDMLAENKTARARLSRQNAKTYDAIARELGKAYEASEGTDSALEQVNAAFCEAIENR